jgi:hypothetical protein
MLQAHKLIIPIILGCVLVISTQVNAAAPKLSTHFAYVELEDRPSADFNAACASFTEYVIDSQTYFRSQGANFTADIRCIHSIHTYDEVGTGDTCDGGLNEGKVRSLIIQGELGWAVPIRNKVNERAAIIVSGGGGYAGTTQVQSGTQNVGLALDGDRGMIQTVTGISSPCGFSYGEPFTLCHELLHVFQVDADSVPVEFCNFQLDAARLKQLLASTNRLWVN